LKFFFISRRTTGKRVLEPAKRAAGEEKFWVLLFSVARHLAWPSQKVRIFTRHIPNYPFRMVAPKRQRYNFKFGINDVAHALIHDWHKYEGCTVKEIAGRINVSCQTVRSALKNPTPPSQRRAAAPPPLIPPARDDHHTPAKDRQEARREVARRRRSQADEAPRRQDPREARVRLPLASGYRPRDQPEPQHHLLRKHCAPRPQGNRIPPFAPTKGSVPQRGPWCTAELITFIKEERDKIPQQQINTMVADFRSRCERCVEVGGDTAPRKKKARTE
jgi:hypothetical protein